MARNTIVIKDHTLDCFAAGAPALVVLLGAWAAAPNVQASVRVAVASAARASMRQVPDMLLIPRKTAGSRRQLARKIRQFAGRAQFLSRAQLT